MGFYIYKYIENEEIVYIGQTIDLISRINQHKVDKLQGLNRIYYFECNNKTEMNSYEYFLIQKYRPKYNEIFNKDYKIDNNDTLMNFTEPLWVLFNNQTIESPKKNIKQQKTSDITPIKNLDYTCFNTDSTDINIINIDLFSLLEQKILIFSILNNNQFDEKKYFTFNKLTGGNNYQLIRTAVQKLLEKDILINKNQNIFLNTKKFNLDLPLKYLKMVFNSTTKYFIPILNATYNDSEKFNISVEWLKNNTDYKAGKDINARIIRPICQTLSNHQIDYTLDIEKNGKAYKTFIIQINNKGVSKCLDNIKN